MARDYWRLESHPIVYIYITTLRQFWKLQNCIKRSRIAISCLMFRPLMPLEVHRKSPQPNFRSKICLNITKNRPSCGIRKMAICCRIREVSAKNLNRSETKRGTSIEYNANFDEWYFLAISAQDPEEWKYYDSPLSSYFVHCSLFTVHCSVTNGGTDARKERERVQREKMDSLKWTYYC